MPKIVYNACFGGFGLSMKAVNLGRKISKDDKWGADPYSMCRHDPVLVKVVEELGDEASSDYAKLKIHGLPSGSKYRIDEYDGSESVCTPDDYEWIDLP